MADEDLDPVSIAALGLMQEVVNQMPGREGTRLWSEDDTSVESRRDLENGRFELLVDGASVVSVDLWPLLESAAEE